MSTFGQKFKIAEIAGRAADSVTLSNPEAKSLVERGKHVELVFQRTINWCAPDIEIVEDLGNLEGTKSPIPIPSADSGRYEIGNETGYPQTGNLVAELTASQLDVPASATYHLAKIPLFGAQSHGFFAAMIGHGLRPATCGELLTLDDKSRLRNKTAKILCLGNVHEKGSCSAIPEMNYFGRGKPRLFAYPPNWIIDPEENLFLVRVNWRWPGQEK